MPCWHGSDRGVTGASGSRSTGSAIWVWTSSRACQKSPVASSRWGARTSRAHEGERYTLADVGTGSFGRLGPEAARADYLQSFSCFGDLTRVDGGRGLRDLCRELTRTADLERSFRRSYGKLPAKLEAEYLEDLRSSRY